MSRAGIIVALLAIALTFVVGGLLSGCSSAPRCALERATLSAARAAVDELEEALPESEDASRSLEATREALTLGDVAVDACEAAEARAGWQAWISLAVRGVAELLEILKAAGVPIPSWVMIAMLALQALGGGS